MHRRFRGGPKTIGGDGGLIYTVMLVGVLAMGILFAQGLIEGGENMLTLTEHNAKVKVEITDKKAKAAMKPSGVTCDCGTEMLEVDGVQMIEDDFYFYRVVCPECGEEGNRLGV